MVNSPAVLICSVDKLLKRNIIESRIPRLLVVYPALGKRDKSNCIPILTGEEKISYFFVVLQIAFF